jgi:Zn-dependent metalloprotease
MATYGPLFGVRDQARELTVKRQKADSGGRSIVRFRQQHNGVPVFAGEVVVHLDRALNVQVAIGELLPEIAASTTPTVGAGRARDTAVAVVARERQVDGARLRAGQPELQIYNRALIGDPGPQTTQLVWRLEVTAGAQEPIRYLVLVDAHSGGVSLKFNQTEEARSRRTYDMNHSSDDALLPGTLVCDESDPACGVGDADARAAHTFAGITHDFYLGRHGRDGIDGAGGAIVSSVHYGIGFANAFWTGSQMVYGDGYAGADDVVAHELTHGVTQYESGLLYFRQSGAINESLSDVWGELIDLTDGQGDDSSGVRWLIAEDLLGGALRSLLNPGLFGAPDRMRSPNYWASSLDTGGVHANSGVSNKAAALLTDGGSFNGKSVAGLGIEKVVRIYYEVQTNLLTPGSDYADLYNALQQACFSLIATNVTTAGDCQQVTNAVQATEMQLPPVVAGAVPTVAPACVPGQTATTVFADDLENVGATSGSFAHAALTGPDAWEYPPSAPYVAATSGSKNFHALNLDTRSSSVYAKTGGMMLPAGAFMRFNHAFSFETDILSVLFRYWHVAVLEYYSDTGATCLSAAPLVQEGGYTGALMLLLSDNPLAGQQAWVGNRDYGSTRLNLSSLAGQSFRFRFRVGTDSTFGADGWFIDDIHIYTCSAGAPAGVTVTPTGGLTTTESGGTATFTVRLNSVPSANVTIGITSSNPNEGVVGPGSLVFTPFDAVNPKTVTVTGVPDAARDGNVGYAIVTSAASSTDAAYNGLAVPNVSVTNLGDCDDRGKVVLGNEPAGPGRRTVTVTAGTGSLQSIQVGYTGQPLVNASLDFPGIGNGLTGQFTRTFSPPQPSVTFTVSRVSPGGSVMVPMIVHDACGPWPTFFGSGPDGF